MRKSQRPSPNEFIIHDLICFAQVVGHLWMMKQQRVKCNNPFQKFDYTTVKRSKKNLLKSTFEKKDKDTNPFAKWAYQPIDEINPRIPEKETKKEKDDSNPFALFAYVPDPSCG